MSDEQIAAAKEREARMRQIRNEAAQRVEQFSPAKRERFEREFWAAGAETRLIERARRTGY